MRATQKIWLTPVTIKELKDQGFIWDIGLLAEEEDPTLAVEVVESRHDGSDARIVVASWDGTTTDGGDPVMSFGGAHKALSGRLLAFRSIPPCSGLRWMSELLCRFPDHLMGGVLRRMVFKIRAGDFLESVIARNLHAATQLADSRSKGSFFDICRLVGSAPDCFLPEEVAETWMRDKASLDILRAIYEQVCGEVAT